MIQTASIQNLELRSRLIHAIRIFFHERGYMEVETPILSPEIIPEAHIDPITCQDHFLMASPELYMKQLLAKGCPKIFQIGKCFRKNERGERHLPELSLLEWYAAHETYEDLMDQCQDLIRFLAKTLGRGNKLSYQGHGLDLSESFAHLTVEEAFKAHADISCQKALALGKYDEIISFDIEPKLGLDRPLFLRDYPKPLASLAELLPNNDSLAQRFELYMAGIELANGFTELTHEPTQRQRFMEENQCRVNHGYAPLPLPEGFLDKLSHLPPAAGIALGLDRLTMIFADVAKIDEIVAFAPTTV